MSFDVLFMRNACTFMTYTLFIIFVVFVALPWIVPFMLAYTALARQHLRKQQLQLRSALYSGRVSHARFHPVKHAFSYPLFIFCLDLKELDQFHDALWPLSLIMNFRESDHLKNKEGCRVEMDKASITERIYQLLNDSLLKQRNIGADGVGNNSRRSEHSQSVSQSTLQPFSPKTHDVLLITHLSYYGYCFNPVSFYLIVNKNSQRLDAVVGEVSNTPWNEMHCYVLTDYNKQDHVQVTRSNEDSSVNYVFPKVFHVSPFMEMHYNYDWTFHEFFADKLHITTKMIQQNSKSSLQFSATMSVSHAGLHPVSTCALYMAWYPVYCFILQVRIHVQAFWLFYKGVPYQPHPEATETIASRTIGMIMTPLFALQAALQRCSKPKSD